MPPLLSEVLQHSSRNFERMRTQMDAINHAQLQSHIDGSKRARGAYVLSGDACCGVRCSLSIALCAHSLRSIRAVFFLHLL